MAVALRVKRLRPGAKLPAYHSDLAAGMDLSADVDGPVFIAPNERRAIPTGIMIEIPSGFEGQVRPRSGRAISEGLTLINSPGTIDADYRGEVRVLVVNLGDGIAQLVIALVVCAEVVEVDELSASARGDGGFGHSGR